MDTLDFPGKFYANDKSQNLFGALFWRQENLYKYLPTIVPSSLVTKPAKPYNPRPTVKARNRVFVSKQNNANGTTPQSRRRLFSEFEEDANSNLENIDPNDPETMPAPGKQTVEESS